MRKLLIIVLAFGTLYATTLKENIKKCNGGDAIACTMAGYDYQAKLYIKCQRQLVRKRKSN